MLESSRWGAAGLVALGALATFAAMRIYSAPTKKATKHRHYDSSDDSDSDQEEVRRKIRDFKKGKGRVKRSYSEEVLVTLPDWTTHLEEWFSRTYEHDEEMMKIAIDLSHRNIMENTGGPFGTAIFERLEDGTAKLISVGCNRVVPCSNSTLHGETVAIQMAQRTLGTYSFRSSGADTRKFELFTSCEPCAMCLGATLWSGVSRIACAATKDDALAIGFDEGPVFEESYNHLRQAGIKVSRQILRKEAAAVLQHYGKIGEIYNP